MRFLLGLLAGLLSLLSGRAEEWKQSFALPAGDVETVLQDYSKTTGVELIYQVHDLRGRHSLGVTGQFSPHEALGQILRGTGLAAVEDAPSGAFVILRAAQKSDPATNALAPPNHPTASAASPPGKLIPGTDIFELSPFEVRNHGESGYRASESVTASRIALRSEQLPLSVNSYNRSFIEDQHPYDLYDVVKWAPGVHQDNISPQGWVRYNLRGYTRAAVQRNGFGAYRFIDTSNIERVEVVKGPASLLYGQINPGGVINYITKRPEAVRRVSLDTSVGSDHFARAVLDLTGPMPQTNNAVLGRLVLMTEDLPQFQTRSSGRKNLYAPSITWNPTASASLNLSYEHFERLDNMPTSGVILRYQNRIPTTPYGPLPQDFSYAGEGDYQDFVSDALTAELTWRIADRVSLQATYLDSTWDMEWRATGQGGTGLLYQSTIDNYYPPSAGLTPADAMYRRNRWEHQWGGERSGQVDLVSDFDLGPVDLRLLIGAKRNFATRYRAQQLNNPNQPGNPLYLKPWDLRDPGTWDRHVPFGIDQLETVADNQSGGNSSSLHAMAMAAFDQGRTRFLAGVSRHQLHNEPSFNLITGAVTDGSERAATVPQLGATHQLFPGITAFASYSKSFLANPSLLLTDNVPTTPAQPSIGRGAEAGLKVDLADGRFSGTFSVYRIRANPTDVIRYTSGIGADGTTLFSELQGGSQRSHGAEVDLLFALRDNLQVIFSSSWCDAIYENHPTSPQFNGTPLVATPESTVNLWAKYAPRGGPLQQWILTGGFNHVGSFSYVAQNPLARLPAYTTMDLAAARQFKIFDHPITAQLMVKNLTNERYYASASTWGFPRQWILSLKTEF